MTPCWLLNENFPQPSVRRLRSIGWDVAAIGEDSPSIDDEVVMDRARAEGRWLATFDRDYGELVFKRGLIAPKLILLLRVSTYTDNGYILHE
jgi:predicted nuclease of predicted toxin-antitoxin system